MTLSQLSRHVQSKKFLDTLAKRLYGFHTYASCVESMAFYGGERGTSRGRILSNRLWSERP